MSQGIRKVLLHSWEFLSYLVPVPSFKSINSSSLHKKSGGSNFTSTSPYKRLRGQNKPTGIELIKVTEPSDTLNYKPLFKQWVLQTILHIFSLLIFAWNKIFYSKKWAVFYIFLFRLGLRCIRRYSIKGSMFLALFVSVNQRFFSYNRCNMLGIVIKAVL